MEHPDSICYELPQQIYYFCEVNLVDKMHVGATALWVALLAAFDARAVADGADDSSSALIAKHYIVEYEPVSDALVNPWEYCGTKPARVGDFTHGIRR